MGLSHDPSQLQQKYRLTASKLQNQLNTTQQARIIDERILNILNNFEEIINQLSRAVNNMNQNLRQHIQANNVEWDRLNQRITRYNNQHREHFHEIQSNLLAIENHLQNNNVIGNDERDQEEQIVSSIVEIELEQKVKEDQESIRKIFSQEEYYDKEVFLQVGFLKKIDVVNQQEQIHRQQFLNEYSWKNILKAAIRSIYQWAAISL